MCVEDACFLLDFVLDLAAKLDQISDLQILLPMLKILSETSRLKIPVSMFFIKLNVFFLSN